MFKRIDVRRELIKERDIAVQAQETLLDEAKTILAEEYAEERKIRNVFVKPGEFSVIGNLAQDTENIFTSDEIKKVCIRYRLRFLDASYYKGEIPYEAIQKIKNFNRGPETDLKKFKILGPSKVFELEDRNADPLLFAPIGNDKFYLIHKWGNDLVWYKRLISLPFRTLNHLLVSIAILATLLTLAMPSWLLTTDPAAPYWNDYRLVFYPWCMVLVGSFVVFFWFALNKNFSSDQWDSKFYN